jgi:hypothetical protein
MPLVVVSILIWIAGNTGSEISGTFSTFSTSIYFSKVLLDVMQALLLFARPPHFDYHRA